MSKISDEMREQADELDVTPIYKLADRIDAEMVELPRGADGETINIWDKTYDRKGNEHTVLILKLYSDGGPKWKVSTNYCESLSPSDLTHERPDSFERIADELDEMVDAAQHADDDCEKLADLAERIRKLAKERGDE